MEWLQLFTQAPPLIRAIPFEILRVGRNGKKSRSHIFFRDTPHIFLFFLHTPLHFFSRTLPQFFLNSAPLRISNGIALMWFNHNNKLLKITSKLYYFLINHKPVKLLWGCVHKFYENLFHKINKNILSIWTFLSSSTSHKFRKTLRLKKGTEKI